jgi:hypothetical protein
MTACNLVTRRAIPFTLDSYEFGERIRYRRRLAQDVDRGTYCSRDRVSSDGTEASFEYSDGASNAFRAGRSAIEWPRCEVMAHARQIPYGDEFVRGWEFAQRWTRRLEVLQ